MSSAFCFQSCGSRRASVASHSAAPQRIDACARPAAPATATASVPAKPASGSPRRSRARPRWRRPATVPPAASHPGCAPGSARRRAGAAPRARRRWRPPDPRNVTITTEVRSMPTPCNRSSSALSPQMTGSPARRALRTLAGSMSMARYSKPCEIEHARQIAANPTESAQDDVLALRDARWRPRPRLAPPMRVGGVARAARCGQCACCSG